MCPLALLSRLPGIEVTVQLAMLAAADSHRVSFI